VLVSDNVSHCRTCREDHWQDEPMEVLCRNRVGGIHGALLSSTEEISEFQVHTNAERLNLLSEKLSIWVVAIIVVCKDSKPSRTSAAMHFDPGNHVRIQRPIELLKHFKVRAKDRDHAKVRQECAIDRRMVRGPSKLESPLDFQRVQLRFGMDQVTCSRIHPSP